MNAVEIEEAISALAERPFDSDEFPYAFLEAFGNKETTLKRLRRGESNKSDLAKHLNAVLQTNNIHIATCTPGEVTATLAALKASPATARAKARFVLATDGDMFEAEDVTSDDPPVACTYADFPNHFGFFLPLAGITTVKQVRESSFDIRATSRLNRLYVELLKDNPDWGTSVRRQDLNHFMARLIFCFFAEDTDIFHGSYPFTGTVERMSAKDSANTHEVISELFRAMNTKTEDRNEHQLVEGDVARGRQGDLLNGSSHLDLLRNGRSKASLSTSNPSRSKAPPSFSEGQRNEIGESDWCGITKPETRKSVSPASRMSGCPVEQLLGFCLHVEAGILIRFVACDGCDALHEIEDTFGRTAFLGQHRIDDLAGLRLGDPDRKAAGQR